MRVLLLLLGLSACAPTEVQEQQACARMGYEAGDSGFWQCMDRMERVHQTNVMAGSAMLGAGTSLLMPQPRMDVYVH